MYRVIPSGNRSGFYMPNKNIVTCKPEREWFRMPNKDTIGYMILDKRYGPIALDSKQFEIALWSTREAAEAWLKQLKHHQQRQGETFDYDRYYINAVVKVL